MLFMAALWVGGLFFIIALYRKYRNNAYLTLSLAAISMIFWASFMAFAFIYSSDFLLRICMVFYAVALTFAVLFFDLIWRESANIYRMTIVVGLALVILVIIWYPDSVAYENIEGFVVPFWNGTFFAISFILLVVSLIFCLHTGIKLWIQMPKYMKKQMSGLVAGVIILAPGSILADIFWGFFGLTIFAIAGIAIAGYYGIRNPQILYILPFVVHRLIVVHRESGISCFDYKWTESDLSEVLLAGLVKALQSISHDILNEGNIREVLLDNGILILQELKYITVGVFASNSSKYLRSCLKQFAHSFEEQYQSEIINGANKTDVFLGATDLIDQHFANIPKRTN
jgi:hypothetical protein